MDEQRVLGRRSAGLLAGLLVACVAGLVVAILLRPRYFTSHEEEIAYILDRHGIAYERITLSQDWRDVQNFYAYESYSYYAAHVTIQLPSTQQVRGRLECQFKRRSCHLYLRSLGIDHEALPDLVEPIRWPWLDWLRHTLLKPVLGL